MHHRLWLSPSFSRSHIYTHAVLFIYNKLLI